MSSAHSLEEQLISLTERVRELEAEVRIDPAVVSIAENSPSNIMLLDRQGRIRYINRTVPDLSVDQVLGTPVYAYVGEEFHESIRSAFERVAATGKPDRYETWYVADNGDTSWWESSVGGVVHNGVVVGFAVISTNVTEQRLLAAEQERFFNLSVDMLCVAGFDGYFKRVNPAFKATLGYGQELPQRPFLEFIHPDDLDDSKAAFQALLNDPNGRLTDYENRYRCRDGSYRRLSWHAVVDRASDSIFAVARDITDKRNLEEQLRHSQKMDAIGKLAGGVAHDFNNLLLAIQGNIEFAMRVDAHKGSEYLAEAMEASQRAAALTQQLLAFSRRQPMRPEHIRLDALLNNLNKMLRRLIPSTIDIALSSAQGLHAIVADRSQIEQVVMNLCVNARDAIVDGGRLAIAADNAWVTSEQASLQSLSRGGSYVRLSITDSGVGMSEAVRARLFEPFFTTKKPGRGTGLGLATVYGIVQQHGGFIQVESKLGHGSTFHVYLPAAEGPPQEQGDAEESPVVGGDELILVAEDQAMVRDVVVEVLERAGYEVLAAEDGEQAVRLFKQHADRVALVVLDVVMPRLNGLDAATLIRSSRPHVEIVFSSGYVDASLDIEQVARSRVVNKPYQPAELLQVVRQMLDESRHRTPS